MNFCRSPSCRFLLTWLSGLFPEYFLFAAFPLQKVFNSLFLIGKVFAFIESFATPSLFALSLNLVIRIFSRILSLCRFPLTGFFLHGRFFRVYRQHPKTFRLYRFLLTKVFYTVGFLRFIDNTRALPVFAAFPFAKGFCFYEFLSPPASPYIGLHGRFFRF